MFSLTIVFGPSPVPWVLLFRDGAKAESAWAVVNACIGAGSDITILEDEFGQRIALTGRMIHGIMLEDMEQSKLAHVEQGLHRARTQAKAQSMAQSDPVLKAAAMMGGAPMLQPGFGNGAFRGQ